MLKIPKNFIGIDLFAGAGGMTLGARQAGIDVQFAVENCKQAGQTYSHNNNNTQLFNDDIRNLRKVPIRKRKSDTLIVFGGPPCQGFSTSNQRTRKVDNANNWLFTEFFRVIELIFPLPEWIVFENVRGFSNTENGIFLKKVIQELQRLGYTTSDSILNAANFGVPQKRNRFFVIASLKGIKVSFPTGTVQKYTTVEDAISDLPVLSVGASESWKPYKSSTQCSYTIGLRGDLIQCANHCVSNNSSLVVERYKYIPQGGNWQDIPIELMTNYKDRSRCHTGIYYRLKENEPSIVIGNYRKNMLVHPTQNRGLSVREAARLQSFPDWYEFKGGVGFQQQQVGNAVPPMLAKTVFETILKY